mmetsp:Transcript_11445/g.30318  ORF Transcript_11445/g.30318 Transcript_11445/m.30318 type:complete len:150 (+) Transcript_11445:283-732(+)
MVFLLITARHFRSLLLMASARMSTKSSTRNISSSSLASLRPSFRHMVYRKRNLSKLAEKDSKMAASKYCRVFLRTLVICQRLFLFSFHVPLPCRGAIVFREIMKADDFLYFQSKMILMWGHMQAREKGTEPPTPRGVCPDANAAKNMKR